MYGTVENTIMKKYPAAKIQEYWLGMGLFCFGSDWVDSGVDCGSVEFLRCTKR